MIITAILSAILWLVIGIVLGISLVGAVMGAWMVVDEPGFDKWIQEKKDELHSKM